MVIYAIANTSGQVAALVFSIDAPLKVLLGDADSKYIPASLCRTNASGTPVNGYFLTGTGGDSDYAADSRHW